MRALELIEERGHEKAGTNDFRKALEDVESVERELRAKNDKGKKKDDGEVSNNAGSVAMVDLGLLKTDPDKLYPVIYYALKRTLKEWEEAMDERPGMSCTGVKFMSNRRYRKRQADSSGQTGCSNASPVCRVSKAAV